MPVFQVWDLSENVRTGLVGLTAFLVSRWLLSLRDARRQKFPAGPRGYPFLGNSLSLGGNDRCHVTLHDWAKEYGEIFSLTIGNYRAIVINTKEAMRELFIDHGDATSDRPVPAALRLLGANRGILNNMGSSWKAQRKVAIASLRDFGLGKKTLEDKILDEADTISESLEQSAGRPIDVQTLMASALVNIICSLIFGERYNYSDKEFLYMTGELEFLFSKGGIKNVWGFFPQFLVLLPFLFPVLAAPLWRVIKLQRLFKRKIQEQRASFDPNNIRHFVDLYIEAETSGETDSDHSESQMFATIIDLFAAGSETSSTTMKWALIHLIRNPHIQDKCREEILSVIGESRRVEYRDHSKMPYMQATIEETLRLSNVAPNTLHHYTSQAFTFRQYHVPKDTLLYANMYTIHLDPRNFEHPTEFRPERWLDSDGHFQRNPAFLAFSIGPRECPGKSLAYQEIFLILTTLIQRFRFETGEPGKLPSLDGKLGITLCPLPFTTRVTRL